MFGKLSFPSREREYNIAPRGIIQSGTIYDSIEQISDPNYTPTTADYLNLVVRYAVGYIHQSPAQRVTRQIADDTLTILCDPMKRSKKEHEYIALCEYQLRMIFDIGATIDVVRDIVEREIDMSKVYTAVDAGSGTVLLFWLNTYKRVDTVSSEKIG